MNILKPTTEWLRWGLAIFCLLLMTGVDLIAGVAVTPGDGGLQIVFSDGGPGTTIITASGTGVTDDDSPSTSSGLGVSNAGGRDLVENSDVLQPLIPNFANLGVSGTITLNLSTYGDFDFRTIISNDTFFGFDLTSGTNDKVNGASQTLTVVSSSGSVALDYSTFAPVHGTSFPTTDGYTLVFALPLPPAPPAVPGSQGVVDLLIGKSFGSLKGDNVYNKRKASNKQTLVRTARIYTTNTQKAALLLQNDGGTAASLTLRSNGDQLPRMKVTARSGGKNVSAAVKAGRFSPMVAPGGSVRVNYQLKTNRFYAGVLRGGDRDDTINFRLSGGGSRDNAAMVVRYTGPAGSARL